tara:strand:+ start:426 stop:650 length:225 start_codon:yes stop_codon:yes gene_type:complete
MKDSHMNTVEDKYENLKKLWWFIMEDNIKLRRKLSLMKAKLSVLEHLSEAEAFRVIGDVPPSPDVDDHFSDAGC